MLKICFMGTPDFAVPTLERLIESGHEICLVVTQPSRPKGRSGAPADPPVKAVADRQGIPVLQPKSLKKEPLDAKIRELGVDVIVVVAFGMLLPDALLAAPKIGCLNVHASLLPEYRGAAPIQRALMDGRLETGVTIMKVASQLDAGPIVSQQALEIHVDDDALSLSNMLSVMGADMLIRALEDIEADGRIEADEQDHRRATYAAKLAKEEGEIDWTASSDSIMHRLRAFTPWPGLFTSLGDKRLKVIQAEPLASGEAEHVGADNALKPGIVSALMKEFGPVVRTGDGHMLLTKLQLEGKSAVDGDAFLRGAKIEVGSALGGRKS